MTTFAPPVVATYGSTDPAAPLVVLLHGRGSNEREILSLAPHLPEGAAYAAVRAPIGEGGCCIFPSATVTRCTRR